MQFSEFFADRILRLVPPCRVGTTLLRQGLEKILNGRGTLADATALEGLANTVARMSRCGLGQTAPNPILSDDAQFSAGLRGATAAAGVPAARHARRSPRHRAQPARGSHRWMSPPLRSASTASSSRRRQDRPSCRPVMPPASTFRGCATIRTSRPRDTAGSAPARSTDDAAAPAPCPPRPDGRGERDAGAADGAGASIEMLFVEGNHFCPSCERAVTASCRPWGTAWGCRADPPYQWPGGNWTPRIRSGCRPQPLRAVRALRARLAHVDGKSVFALEGRGIHMRLNVDGRHLDETTSRRSTRPCRSVRLAA